MITMIRVVVLLMMLPVLMRAFELRQAVWARAVAQAEMLSEARNTIPTPTVVTEDNTTSTQEQNEGEECSQQSNIRVELHSQATANGKTVTKDTVTCTTGTTIIDETNGGASVHQEIRIGQSTSEE